MYYHENKMTFEELIDRMNELLYRVRNLGKRN